ncbi:ArsA-related P-loop ATPase, partial [Streptomyces albidoflavus]|uniref:ArsA-related P-loop ATPase n=1 Tax=Streptomyces albidoflavus TaxID=1886 RepID=UPI0026E59495
MRTVLVTGPGGAGRTTLAAATARAAARTGTRVLLLTADPGDRLGTALGTPLGPAPVEAAPGLHALRLDAAARLRADLLALQERAATAILLVCIRMIQGIGLGGEWGGSVLIASEHAPKG